MPTHTAFELLQHLSPAFLTPDDAARYAMALIDRRQDRAMGGYILIDADEQYQATLPLEGGMDDFLLQDITMENAWDRLMPEGYRYVAYYLYDRDRQFQIKRSRPSWSAQRIALTMSLPAGRAVAACYGGLASRLYTVGPEGSLVLFVALGTQRPQWPALPAEQEPVERYVHGLASRGTLSVVVPSPVWMGWRGEVSLRWKAYLPDTQPTMTHPFYSQVYPDAQAAMVFAQQRLLLNPKARQLGYVLKHRSQARFVVTEPQPAEEPVFDLQRVFPSGADGVSVPLYYVFVGMYWLAIDTPAPPSVTEPWLYERIIPPLVLAHGIDLQRALKVPGMALYVSTFDGALLRYEISNADAESRFYNPPERAQHGIDNGQQAALDEGRLPVRTYIQQVAAAGHLTVEKTSALWDVPGRIDAAWQPYSRHPQASLSPSFLLPDDAARYAHARIGSRREREYIGLILKSAQQRFVATEPQENPGARFDLSQVGPVDRTGLPVVMPAGFSLHGVYSSRAHAAVAGDDEAQVAAQMFMDTDIHQALKLAPSVSVTYLSGSADSLLAFQPYTQELTRELYEASAPASGGSQLERQLQDHSLVPSDVVRAMVLAGTLRVVLGNRVWGGPAQVENDWSPPFDLDDRHVPAQPQLGPIFATAREAVDDACERWWRAYALAPQGLGVVLESLKGDAFVATQTVPGAVLDRLLFASEFGAPVLTEQFRVHAVYYRASALPKGLSGQAAWVARHFIGAEDLYAALYNQQGGRRASLARALGVYLAPLDGALLELRAGFDPFALFLNEAGAIDPHALPAKLHQALTTQAYVRQVANAGQLSVLRASTCWDVPGRVGQDWLASAEVNRHQLVPCFISADDAARHAQARLANRRDRVYGGLILRRTDGLYTATLPEPVYVEDFAPGWIRRDDLVAQSQFLGGSTAVARYHSRLTGELPFALSDGERAVYQNMFATDFLGAMLSEPSQSTGLEYVFCDDGALLSVATAGGALEHALAANLAVRGAVHPKDNALERSMRDATLTPSEYVSRVSRALVLRVVKGSTLWGRAAQVKEWRAAELTDGVPPLSVDVAISPVFVQLTDALRYAHRQSGQRRQLTFGVVLKARTVEHYLVSVPVAAGGLALSLDRILVNAAPPTGFELLGWYLCPPAQPQMLKDDPLYRYVVSPSDLSRAWGLQPPGNGQFLPVFVGCIDGAWLRMLPRSAAPLPSDVEQQLKSATLQPLAYVHQLAKNVELTVLLTSEVWSAKGRVGADWRPRREARRDDPSLVFGPLFAHPDDAARYAQRRLGGAPDNKWLGLVLTDRLATSFVALEPVPDAGTSVALHRRLFQLESSWLDPSPPAPAYPQGFKLLAVHLLFHRMFREPDDTPADQRLGEHFAPRDTLRFFRNLLWVGRGRGGFCYLSTPQGGLLKYVPRYTEREEQLFTGGFFGPPALRPTQWLSRLAGDGALQVLDKDDYWTRSGVVKVDWTAKEQPVLEVQPVDQTRQEL